MTLRQSIYSQIERVAAEQNKTLPTLKDEMALLDTGLDSLCFAILVTRLEDELKFDPFSTADDVEFPVTLGDLVRVYEHAPA